MPKIRTNKTAVKRFKITGTGRITRRKSFNSHQFLHKGPSQKRRLELEPEVFQGERKRMRRLLVMGHPKDKSEVSVQDAKTARTDRHVGDRAKLLAMVS